MMHITAKKVHILRKKNHRFHQAGTAPIRPSPLNRDMDRAPSSRMVNSKAMVHIANRLTQPTLRPVVLQAVMANSHMGLPMDSSHQPAVVIMLLQPHRKAILNQCKVMEAAAMIPPQLLPRQPATLRPLMVGRPAMEPSLHILDMDNSLLLLHLPAVTVLGASSLPDMSRARTPSSLSKALILSSSREDTRASKEATDSRAPIASREDINKLLPSSSRLRLPAMLRLLDLMDSLLPVSMDSRAVLEEVMANQTINHQTSMVVTDQTIRMEVAILALNLEDMGALERAEAWEGGRTAGAAGVGLTGE